MLSDKDIENAKKTVKYDTPSPNHQHPDCIRIAYEWLDAQIKTKSPKTPAYDWKGMIEKWAGRYVSKSDVTVAASMHPDIRGEFPHYNVSKRYTDPSTERLQEIPQAFKHPNYRKNHNRNHYKYYEMNGSRFPARKEKA